MTAITAQMVKELRESTGAGMMDCKKALSETNGDMSAAVEYLRKKGLKSVEKRSGKVAAEGVVYSYIHTGGRVGVMLELNCETDFVARGDDFLELAKTLAMHIAWSSPQYISEEEVPESIKEKEQDIFRSQLSAKQQEMADKILPGKMKKFYEENCLLLQLDARDANAKKRIGDLIDDLSAKIGEKIGIRRFTRFEVGEGIEKQATDYAQEVAEAMNS